MMYDPNSLPRNSPANAAKINVTTRKRVQPSGFIHPDLHQHLERDNHRQQTRTSQPSQADSRVTFRKVTMTKTDKEGQANINATRIINHHTTTKDRTVANDIKAADCVAQIMKKSNLSKDKTILSTLYSM